MSREHTRGESKPPADAALHVFVTPELHSLLSSLWMVATETWQSVPQPPEQSSCTPLDESGLLFEVDLQILVRTLSPETELTRRREYSRRISPSADPVCLFTALADCPVYGFHEACGRRKDSHDSGSGRCGMKNTPKSKAKVEPEQKCYLDTQERRAVAAEGR